MVGDWLLNSLVFLPLLGMLLVALLSDRLAKSIALFTSLIGTSLGVVLYTKFVASDSQHLQFAFTVPWISAYNINFALGVDGLSFPLVLLTKFMVPIAILASWNESRHAKAFMASYLLLDTGMTGTFLATDIFLFYVFWEMMLIPMLLLIGVWGSQERIFAALKFFLFTFAGSILMLASIFWIFVAYHSQFGVYSGDITELAKVTFLSKETFLGLTRQELVFWGFCLAFLVKVPLFPLHTWLPDAHVQAPTGGSILLAAVLLKMGTYGILRFSIPLCPEAFLKWAPFLAILSLIGILYGAWVAYRQSDMKKLVAYSSVSHLAFVVLGICAVNAEGLTGATLQMVNHGLTTGALFFLVGALYERRHSRNFDDYGGLASLLPGFSIVLVFVSAASMAVPGLNGFVGEFLILFGAFATKPVWGAVAALGVIFGALYTLVFIRKVLFGEVTHSENRTLKDLSKREWCALIPLCVFMVILGVYPRLLTTKIESSLQTYWSTNYSKILTPGVSEHE